MLTLDASAVVALVAGEPGAVPVRDALRRERASISTVNIAEAVDALIRSHGIPRASVEGAIDTLVAGTTDVVSVGLSHAVAAGRLRAAPYKRQSRALSVADCLLIACAPRDSRVVSSDEALLAAAESEGLSTLPIPPSSG